MSLEPLFRPKTIALIGAAHTELKLGGVVLKNLLKFRGKVYPVNPKYDELMGMKAYTSVADIPEPVDLAVILRPAPEVPGILRELGKSARCVIISSSGFAEVGETALQEEVRSIRQEKGFRMLGPNCMGVFNPDHKLDTFFLPQARLRRPGKGNVAVVSQSGALLSCLLEAVREAKTGISIAVGYGNAVDIDESDIYEYLAADRKTEVVVSYIESVGDGRKYVRNARALSERKPLLVLKSGKGESGQAAAFSHTGRLAGRYEVFHSILKQQGIREIMDFDGLLDSAKALSYQRKSGGNRICIITNGGGSGVLAADECMRQGIEVPPLPVEKREKLTSLFPHFYGINNPVDLTAQVQDEDFRTALVELRDAYDGFLVIVLPNVFGITERLPEVLKDARGKISKPIVASIPPGGIAAKLVSRIEKAGIPSYPTPERAVRGLKALLR